MLEHQMTVLRGVSHDKALFRKELIKSMAWLDSHEQTQLRRWVSEHYQSVHPEIIKELLYTSFGQA